jgi:hypothetical protein
MDKQQQQQDIMIERQRRAIHDYVNRQRMAEMVKPPKPDNGKRG